MKILLIILSSFSTSTILFSTVISCSSPNENIYKKYEFNKYFSCDYEYGTEIEDIHNEIIKNLSKEYKDLVFIKFDELNSNEYKVSSELQTIFVVNFDNEKESEIKVQQFNSDDNVTWNKLPSYETSIYISLYVKWRDGETIITDFLEYRKNDLGKTLNEQFLNFINSKTGVNLEKMNFEFEVVDKTGKPIDVDDINNLENIDILSINSIKKENHEGFIEMDVSLEKQSSIVYDIQNLDADIELKWSDRKEWARDFNGLNRYIMEKMTSKMEEDTKIDSSISFYKEWLNNDNIQVEYINEVNPEDKLTEETYNEEKAQELCENNKVYFGTYKIQTYIDNHYYLVTGTATLTLKFTN